MKKLISFLLTFSLMFVFSALCFADNFFEYSWSTQESNFYDRFGNQYLPWLVEEVDAQLFASITFLPVELTEADRADGCIGFLASDTGEYIAFYYTDSDGLTLDALYNYYIQNNYLADSISVNDIPAVLLHDDNNNILILTYLTQNNKLFQIMFSPLSEKADVFDYVIASIQPYVEETSDTEPVVSVNPVSGLISK